jgi:hypothetical protein
MIKISTKFKTVRAAPKCRKCPTGILRNTMWNMMSCSKCTHIQVI